MRRRVKKTQGLMPRERQDPSLSFKKEMDMNHSSPRFNPAGRDRSHLAAFDNDPILARVQAALSEMGNNPGPVVVAAGNTGSQIMNHLIGISASRPSGGKETTPTDGEQAPKDSRGQEPAAVGAVMPTLMGPGAPTAKKQTPQSGPAKPDGGGSTRSVDSAKAAPANTATPPPSPAGCAPPAPTMCSAPPPPPIAAAAPNMSPAV